MRSTQNLVHWSCDACGCAETRTDTSFPPYWRKIVMGTMSERLGNKPGQDLCGDCAEKVSLILTGQPEREKESTS